MKKLFLILLIVLIFTINTNAQVEEEVAFHFRASSNTALRFNEKIDRQSTFLQQMNAAKEAYSDSPANKMGTGMLNAATAWVDLPTQMSEVSGEKNILAGLTLGLGKGIVSGLKRGASGVIDMATFSLPPYDAPLMQPEYKVKHPDQGFKVELLKW